MTTAVEEVGHQDIDTVLNTIKFGVRTEPLFTESGLPTKNVGIVREDTEKVIGVASDRYSLVKHYDAVAPLVEKAAKLGFVFPKRALAKAHVQGARIEKNGARVYVEMWNPQVSSIIGGAVHHPRIQVFNSYDTTTRVGVIAGGYVVKCTNGMVSLHDMLGFRGKRHLGDISNEAERMGELAMRFMENYEEVSKAWSKLDDFVPGEELATKAIHEVSIRKADDIIAKVESEYLDTATGWQVFQGITNHLTHQFKGATALAVVKQRAALRVLQNA